MLFTFLAFIFGSGSCRSNSNSFIFKAAINGNPKTLDPQCALNDSSYTVIYNVFQGLFTYNKSGEIVNGMINSYSVSEDGLTWTFQLKDDVKWSDGGDFEAECTANDYVFAFQRLFKPATKSERASEFYIIKNAEKINKGKITDISELGVKALDSYTLEITLEKPYLDFKTLLTLPPAMPCNEEYFFSTEGRYGLAAECVASNSDYYVHTWSYDKWSDDNNYFILRKNKVNVSGKDIPSGINYFINPVDEYKDFSEENLSVYIAKNADEVDDLIKNYDYITHDTGVWGIIFNLNGDFSDYDYRVSLADNINYVGENKIYTTAQRIIPNCINIDNNTYTSISTDVSKNYKSIVANVGRLTSKTIIMPADSDLRNTIGDICQKWQSEHGFYCGISELEHSEYNSALMNGSFDIALVKLSGEYNSPYAYLNNFLRSNFENYSAYKNNKFEHIINSALTLTDYNDTAVFYAEAEQLLIDNAIFVPLCIETEYIFTSEKVSGVWYNPFTRSYSYEGK